LCLCALLASSVRARQSASPPQLAPETNNVLVIVGDDEGNDVIHCYGEHPQAPPTPNIDALAARGVLFRNAYSQPVCSPTRATILTGRYGFRTLMGIAIDGLVPQYSLAQGEITLPELLNTGKPGQLACSAIGKWHLGPLTGGGELDPNQQGFEWYSGTLGNFMGQSYYDHDKVVNGVVFPSTTYATTEQVDDALARIQVMPQPWFCYLAFNAAHRPFHAPPSNLHTYTLSGPPNQTGATHFRAAVQAMDTEIGRLLSSIDSEVLERTTIIFLGDNGTPPEATLAPLVGTKAKGTLYEGGVNVPLIVAGRGVDAYGVECPAFVNTVDLFPTIAELLGTPVHGELADGRRIDGVSLLPLFSDPMHAPVRPWVYADKFDPNGPGPYTSLGRMIRNERWKVITRDGGTDLFFDMQGLSVEGANIPLTDLNPEQRAAYDWLKREMGNLLVSP
jgi:arylsulfatase A-like enzyme